MEFPEVEYIPEEHDKHDKLPVSPVKWPLEQAKQDDAADCEEKKPESQGMQALEAEAPADGRYLPNPQAVQEDDAVDPAYCPASHCAQEEAPGESCE